MAKALLKALIIGSRWRIISLQLTFVVNFHDNSQCVVTTSIEDLLTKIDS